MTMVRQRKKLEVIEFILLENSKLSTSICVSQVPKDIHYIL